MAKPSFALTTGGQDPAQLLADTLFRFLAEVPVSDRQTESNPLEAAQRLTRAAATKAALTSGTLAMAPGPLGLLTLLPDLVAVWKIQSQLVSDIAAVYGRSATLGREQMLYCLFRHSAAQVVRDMVVRAGERYVAKRASLSLLKTISGKLGVTLSKKLAGNGLSRFLPLVGAVGVGGYAYYDTTQVAATAIEIFER
jgi:EcsC protein family